MSEVIRENKDSYQVYKVSYNYLLPDEDENRKAFIKEYKKLKTKFLRIIVDNIEDWWD